MISEDLTVGNLVGYGGALFDVEEGNVDGVDVVEYFSTSFVLQGGELLLDEDSVVVVSLHLVKYACAASSVEAESGMLSSEISRSDMYSCTRFLSKLM